ncbi:MAG: PTS sugar transporter subunit IIB, partial [Desulfuromonadaceae bacterium]
RLIHGQVLESWVPHVKADCIVVANDKIAGTPLQKAFMISAVPRAIRVIIDTVERAAVALLSEGLAQNNVLLLLANSLDILKIHRLGVKFSTVNIGNMHGGEGKQRVTCTIALAPEDVLYFKELEAEGIRIVSQCIPSDRAQDWKKFLSLIGG